MIQFDEHIFQMGWFNHHLAKEISKIHGLFSTLTHTYLAILRGCDRFGMVKKTDLFDG